MPAEFFRPMYTCWTCGLPKSYVRDGVCPECLDEGIKLSRRKIGVSSLRYPAYAVHTVAYAANTGWPSRSELVFYEGHWHAY